MQHTTSHITQPAQTARRGRLPRFLRSVSPAAVTVTVSLLIGGAGFADAATGGNFILGKANQETSTASLSDAKGTPLALSAPAGKAPLAVNRNVMVHNLNAQYLGGLTAAGLAATGGEGFTAPNTNAPISYGAGPVVVARTGKLPAGTYYVTATAFVEVSPGDGPVVCWITKATAPSHEYDPGGFGQAGGAFTAAETAAVNVTAGDALEEVCQDYGINPGIVINAGIV